MTMRESATNFRALHERDGIFVIPNPWDTGSARVLAAMGYEALATTSAGLAFSRGVMEGVLGQEAVLTHCRELVAATDLPVSADLEKGFGDGPEDVARTIRAAAGAGLAGCSIEDHTNRRDDPIFDFGLAVERIQAGVEAKRDLDHDFVLTARAENLLWDRMDLDDTIRRLQSFDAAGADVLYAPGLYDLESITAVCASVDKPVNVVMGMPGATFGLEELAAAGVKRVSLGSALFRAAFGGFHRAAVEIKEQGTFTFSSQATGFAEIESHFTGHAAP
jgi:2-methylisocitrate lyase-like PEP mutase family enzyme